MCFKMSKLTRDYGTTLWQKNRDFGSIKSFFLPFRKRIVGYFAYERLEEH